MSIIAEQRCSEQQRKRWIVARGLLRAILGGYLDMRPDRLQFCYGPNGKPARTRQLGGEVFRFNLSHSYGLALYAVTQGREIGIDLERIRLNRSKSRLPSASSLHGKLLNSAHSL